jgi:hypothetical protein
MCRPSSLPCEIRLVVDHRSQVEIRGWRYQYSLFKCWLVLNCFGRTVCDLRVFVITHRFFLICHWSIINFVIVFFLLQRRYLLVATTTIFALLTHYIFYRMIDRCDFWDMRVFIDLHIFPALFNIIKILFIDPWGFFDLWTYLAWHLSLKWGEWRLSHRLRYELLTECTFSMLLCNPYKPDVI